MSDPTTTVPPPPRRTLYQIGADLLALDALLDEANGDLSDPAVEAAAAAWFDALAAEEAAKLDGWIGYVRQLEMEAAAAKAEAEQWLTRVRSREARVAWLKERLKRHLEATGRTKATTLSGRTIAVQANGGHPPVEIDAVDPYGVADRLCEVRRLIDREKVRTALLAGEGLSFARLVPRGTHLRIR